MFLEVQEDSLLMDLVALERLKVSACVDMSIDAYNLSPKSLGCLMLPEICHFYALCMLCPVKIRSQCAAFTTH